MISHSSDIKVSGRSLVDVDSRAFALWVAVINGGLAGQSVE